MTVDPHDLTLLKGPRKGVLLNADPGYARWIAPHPTTRSKWRVGYSDGSAHRIISDLSAFIGNADHSTHRILAAGDLNLIYESNASDPQALEERGNGVFQRFKTIGLEMVGPQYPAGRKLIALRAQGRGEGVPDAVRMA